MNCTKSLKKAEQALQKEMNKQIEIIYPACAVVWWQEYGWRALRINRRFETSSRIWTECADYGAEKSMLQMLEEETGIDLQLSGYRDWHELQYVDGRAWDGKPLTLPQAIYMRQMQKTWVAPLILAGICLTLYRDEHWGAERIGRFISLVDQLREEIGERPDEFCKLMEDVTGTEILWEDKHVGLHS